MNFFLADIYINPFFLISFESHSLITMIFFPIFSFLFLLFVVMLILYQFIYGFIDPIEKIKYIAKDFIKKFDNRFHFIPAPFIIYNN